MGIAWREFQIYGHGYRYRLGTHHKGRHSYEIATPDGKNIERSGYASAFLARKAAFKHLAKLTEEQRGAA